MPKPITGYKVTKDKDGKVRLEPDHAARDAKLNLCTRLRKRNSQKVTVVKKVG